jgi:hypothetical protein
LLLERGLDTQTVVFAIAVIGPAQVAGRIAIWAFAPAVQSRVVGIAGRCRISPRLSRTDGYTASVCGDRTNRCDLWRSKWDHDHCSWPRDTGNANTRCVWAINGALAVPTIVAKAAAPFGAALLWDRSGSYGPVLIALLGGSLLLVIAFWVSAFLVTRDQVSIP